MANVMFKRGPQKNLDAMTSYVNGAFYLTTDTDRLYVAQSESELVELNKSIHTIANYAALPKTPTATSVNGGPAGSEVALGQFYYITDGNMLVVCSNIGASTIGWTQINPDHVFTVEDFVIGGSNGVGLSAAEISAITPATGDYNDTDHTLTFYYNYTYDESGTPKKKNGAFKITRDQLTNLAGVSVDIGATVNGTSGVATIKTSGSGSNTAGHGFTVTPGTNVNITGSGNNITVAATDTSYVTTVETGANPHVAIEEKINGSKSGTDIGFDITGDGTYIKAQGSATGVAISHLSPSSLGGAKTNIGNNNGGTLNDGTEFKIPKISTDAAGHVTALSDVTLKMPSYQQPTLSVAAENGTDLVVELEDAHGYTTGQTVMHALSTKIGDTVYGYDTALPVYTKDEIDFKFRGLDAMRFMGTISTTAGVPVSGIERGDTYKITGTNVKVNNSPVNDGDLIVATGTETNGVLTSVTWVVIPAGDDIDTTYAFSAAINGAAGSNQVKLILTNDKNPTDVQNVVIKGDDDIGVSISSDQIQIAHKGAAATATTAGVQTWQQGSQKNFITGVTTDSTGHLTGYTVQPVELADVNWTASVDTNGTNKAKIFLKKDGFDNETSVGIDGDGVIIAAKNTDGTAVNLTHKSQPNLTNATGTYGSASSQATTQQTFNVPAIQVDSYGHITSIQNKEVAVRTPNYQFDTTVVPEIGSNSGVQFAQFNLTLTDESDDTFTTEELLRLNSSTLSFKNAIRNGSEQVTIDLEWGTF